MATSTFTMDKGASDAPTLCLARFSVGVGDRFAHQAKAQLRACQLAMADGIEITPVWNKSNREHEIVGSEPITLQVAAQRAVAELGWTRPFHSDADHITLRTVDRFLASSDFYTLDVADYIGQPANPAEISSFVASHPELQKRIDLSGDAGFLQLSASEVGLYATKYLFAVKSAAEIYRHIVTVKGVGRFITEVSMDETDAPQTPGEMLIILAALADEKVPLQTIAPKFTGRFNKGVDYVGDVSQFEREFRGDVAVIAHAVQSYGLPSNLKLSIHSGSDKFSIFPVIRRALTDFGAGVHLKTAGTTWLEELIGLAEASGSGLELAKQIYAQAYSRREELCKPYVTVIDIDIAKLPLPAEVQGWSSRQFTSALRHDQTNPAYNLNLRQLLHVGYKIAAEMGDRYLDALDTNEITIARNVTANLYERHFKIVFPRS